MASGDILSCTVRADGWSCDVVVDGAAYSTGATYDFGSLDDTPASVASPTFTMTVVSEGYNSAGVLGTITRTIYGTHVVRKAYPNQAQKDETDSGTTLSVRVALSESVYADDKNGGAGTSGTNPTVTIASGWCVSGANNSNAATNLAVTNNSTLAYPKVIAQWAWGHTPAFRRVAADFTMGCIAYHGHGIAAVKLSATNGTTKEAFVTTKTDHTMSASGLHYESYDYAVALSGWSEGDITLRYIAYPTVGDASSIIDTSTDTSTTNIPKGFTQITATYKVTGVVSVTAGVGGTYATIAAALATSPDEIVVKSNIDAVGGTVASMVTRSYCVEVVPEVGGITLTRTTSSYRHKAKHLRYSGFTISSAGEAYSFEEDTTATYTLQFANCSIARTGGLSGQPPGMNTHALFYTNCSWDGIDSHGAENLWHYVITGCSMAGGVINPRGFVANKVLGNNVANATRINEIATGDTTDNTLYVNNLILNINVDGAAGILIGGAKSATNVAFIGNVFECRVSGLNQLLSFCEGAGGLNYASANTILAHNTLVGQRENIYYDDVAGVTLHQNAFVRNNAFTTFNSKADTFSFDAALIGNWSVAEGVNVSDNRYDGTSGFPPYYMGINCAWVTGSDSTYGQLGFVDDASQYGDGTGNGDYTPTALSALYNHPLRVTYLSYDQNGNQL